MFRLLYLNIFAATLFVSNAALAAVDRTMPRANKIEKKLEIHGDVRIDPYYWMRFKNEYPVLDFLKTEETYYQSYFSAEDLKLKETMVNEMKSRVFLDDESQHKQYAGYEYYTKTKDGLDYPLIYRKKVGETTEELVIDQNELAKGHSYFSILNSSVSPDGKYFAYCVDYTGSGECTIAIKDLAGQIADKNLTAKVNWGEFIWAPDSQGLYYSASDEAFRPYRLYYHVLSESKQNDKLVFEDKDGAYEVRPKLSSDTKKAWVTSASFDTTKIYTLSANKANELFKVIENNIISMIENTSFGDIVSSDHEFKNQAIYLIPNNGAPREKWKMVYAAPANSIINSFVVFGDDVVVSVMQEGIFEVYVLNLQTLEAKKLAWPDEVYMTDVSLAGSEGGVVINYSSPKDPERVYNLDPKTLKLTLIKDSKTESFDPAKYETKKLTFTSRDGQKIPAFAVYKKGLELNGQNPLLLDAYSAYGITIESRFNSKYISLLDRGWVYVLTHARGSSANGYQWYQNGRLGQKKNTFNDVVDSALALIEMKYSQPKKMALVGGSAGGLTLGAVINDRPDLFSAAIARVAFVDTLTTMLDDTIPLTTQEYTQWGNPNELEAYNYIKSYSPYDNIKAQAYPAVLAVTGISDQQVGFWEPSKWVQKLRDNSTSGREIMLDISFTGGHGGDKGRTAVMNKSAEQLIFLLKETAK